LQRFSSSHRDALVRAPRPNHLDVRVVDSAHANMCILPSVRRKRYMAEQTIRPVRIKGYASPFSSLARVSTRS
jgi:hypothetical protein